MSNITREQLTAGKAYPVGKYELEIKETDHVEGTSAKGKWEKLVLKCEIVSPDTLAGRRFTTGIWYDAMLGKIITVGMGKSLDDIFGKDNAIDREKLRDLMRGQFITVRLGIDQKGYNNIAEVLPPEDDIKV